MKDETLLPDVAEAVREALDRISCPDAYMRVAVEACRAALQDGNSPAVPNGSLVNSARALMDALYEFGPDEVAISECVQNLEDSLRNVAALQSGNSGKLNRANSFTDDELMGMAYGDNPVANAYRELLEFRRNAAGGNSAQPVTVPEGELQKAIFAACLAFLYSCNNGKSYEDTFYDPTTEYYLDISVIAEEIGVVQVMGNRRWLPSKEVQDEIEGVYRKYAMRIMEAAPKVTP